MASKPRPTILSMSLSALRDVMSRSTDREQILYDAYWAETHAAKPRQERVAELRRMIADDATFDYSKRVTGGK